LNRQDAKIAKEQPERGTKKHKKGSHVACWTCVLERGVGTGTWLKACRGEAAGTPKESGAGTAPHRAARPLQAAKLKAVSRG